MAHDSHHDEPQIVEQFDLPAKARRYLYILLTAGFVLAAVGGFVGYRSYQAHPYHTQVRTYTPQGQPYQSRHEVIGGEHLGATLSGGLNNAPEDVRPYEPVATAHDAHHKAETAAEGSASTALPGGQDEAHHGPTFATRLWSNFLLNNLYWLGVAVLALFFIMVQTVSDAGWYVIIKRVLEAMMTWLPIGAILLLLVLLGIHNLYHWSDEAAVAKDHLLQKKVAWLNVPGFSIRMVILLVIFLALAWFIRRSSIKEDSEGGLGQFNRQKAISAAGLFIFGIAFSVAAWDWVMSLDPHWFSTMFSVHLFASLLVTAVSILTLLAIFLKKSGFLPGFTDSHLHDLGKFVFAFSIFWTYIWFCQFLLIWYANIPEETAYYFARVGPDSVYKELFVALPIINFAVPFLALMTAGSKRNYEYLAVICLVVLVGHWLDLYLMIFPSTMQQNLTVGLLELGMWLLYGAAFLLVTAWGLKRASLVPKQHPYLRETLHHNYH